MTDDHALYAVSPLDGRYSGRTDALAPYVSEAALMRARVEVEAEYVLALADLDAVPLELVGDERTALRDAYKTFDAADADLVKRIETEGALGHAATNHDVKAVEYFLREHAPARAHSWIHFGLTSEDVNNLAYRLLVDGAITAVLTPELRGLRDDLVSFAHDYADLPMLARTHGQPATPTTFGKEMAVYAARLGRALARITDAVDGLTGKLAGASGTWAAHTAAFPDVDWRSFAARFVDSLGLAYAEPTTQVNPCDDLAAVFDAVAGANGVLEDLAVDAWLYVSQRYLGQDAADGETGSSTMPHKVNPIDFENAEGNLAKANSDLGFLGDSLTTSRLQRDLSDSTVKRNIGAAFAHCLLAYRKLGDGLDAVTPNEAVLREDLRANPEVIGEAVQTILRREGHDDAYERVKALTRGERVSLDDFQELFASLDIDADTRDELLALTPERYVGVAADIARDA
ncbi:MULTISPECIES: adenylosuccinate lyase [Halobacterium]|uniref:adenylosuccinate lyase n=1 Tax=Halobacterium TaxID=2239 RepID=UPI0019662CDE|nr:MULTISPECIES: adenylosuccinate lyase [Halobacterium]MDL0122685.1 adenylosuccinate lyase [Halobacterium salinarum]MDL0128182.1 adenylosuccinate lyase [Halobacterium salinarum]MDL0134273.1 adenylosuccinate lyase [Halobacterium salinarum]QRY25108.1 adenylosuccinate lyase [Halobacterium sp. BOL4-2]